MAERNPVARQLSVALAALWKIRDGREERCPDGSTVVADWMPGDAAEIAGAALQQIDAIDKKATAGPCIRREGKEDG